MMLVTGLDHIQWSNVQIGIFNDTSQYHSGITPILHLLNRHRHQRQAQICQFHRGSLEEAYTLLFLDSTDDSPR